MSLNTNAILTVDILKAYLSITDSTDDADCESCINFVSDLFESIKGYEIKAKDVTEYYDGTGDDTLFLRGRTSEAVSSVFVYIDISREFADDTAVDHDDLYIDARLGRLVYQYGTFTEGAGVIKVVRRSGWETIPEDLQWAAKETCKWFRDRRDKSTIGLSSITPQAGGSVSILEKELPAAIKEILARYP